MGQVFLVKFPPGFSKTKQKELCEFIERWSFMPIPRNKSEDEFMFFFEGDNQTPESFRERFSIPAACEVIESGFPV